MGIKQLMKLIMEEAPDALKEREMENLNDRKVAIDASMAIYQFLVAVRASGQGASGQSAQLTNEAGEVTSHIQGMFNRTIKMMETGVKPLYVFDGKPPQMKGGELAKRLAKRDKATADLAAATEAGDGGDMDKYSRRLVHATRQHSNECKELLALMGVPFITAPCEAEAQCAELARKGKVYATATEDMDALTFRTPKLLRKFTSSQGKDKQPIIEVDYEKMLEGLGLTYEQFVDLCILCGCDYCSTIRGIGSKTALKLIKTHGTIEKVVAALRREKKYEIPPDWQPIRVSKKARLLAEAAQAKADEEAAEAAEALAKAEMEAQMKAVAAAKEAAAAAAAAGVSSSSASASASSSGEEGEDMVVADGEEGATAAAEEVAGDKEAEVAEGQEGEAEAMAVVEGEENVAAAEASTTEQEPEEKENVQTAVNDVVVPVLAVAATGSDSCGGGVEDTDAASSAPAPAATSSSSSSSSSSAEAVDGADGTAGAVQGDDDEPEILNIATEGDEEDDEYEVIEPLYVQARVLFTTPEVQDASTVDVKWEEPKEEALKAFLVERMGFNADRVKTAIERLQAAHKKKSQKRMDSFFTSAGVSQSSTSLKRKADEAAGAGKDKKGKGAATAGKGKGSGGGAGKGKAGPGKKR